MTAEADLVVEVGFTSAPFLEVSGAGWAATPDTNGLSIAGDIDLRFFGAAETWADTCDMLGKWESGELSYKLGLNTGGEPTLQISSNGVSSQFQECSVPIPAIDGEAIGVRATWRTSDGRVQWFTSVDDGDSWTQLGSNGLITLGSVFDSDAEARIGDLGGSVFPGFRGRVFRAEIRDGINGTIVAAPDFTDRTEWAVGDDAGDTGDDPEGNTWTLGGDAEVGHAPRPMDADATWSDETALCREVAISRGKSSLTGHYDAGTATIVFDNRDGRFSPHNTQGEHYPFVKIGNQIRVRASVDGGGESTLFRGVAEAWPIHYDKPDATVSVPVVDAFKLLNLVPLRGVTLPAGSTTERVNAVLDAAIFPGQLRSVAEGVALVPASTIDDDTSALAHLLEVADSEQGSFFIASDGSAAFTSRIHHSGGAASQATFGPNDLLFQSAVLSFDDDYLYNDVRVTADGGTEQQAVDQVSIDAHGRRVLTVDDIPLVGDAHALNVAEWMVAKFAEQKVRIRRLVLDPRRDADLFAQALARDLDDVVTVQVTAPTGGGDTLEQDCAIIGIEHRWRPGDWRTVWELQPLVDLQQESFWTVGPSELGTDTVLA